MPDHKLIHSADSNTLRLEIAYLKGYLLAKIEDIKDVVERDIRILEDYRKHFDHQK